MTETLNDRAGAILKLVVLSYLESGEPLGSRSLSKKLENALSPATIRNVMADLQDMGLIYAPHTSAGRLPTEMGLRLYVDTLMGHSKLNPKDRAALEQQCRDDGYPVNDILERTSRVMAGLSSCAGLFIVPKHDRAIRHIEFLSLEKGTALAVLVLDDGSVENRLMDVPPEITAADLKRASNFLKEKMYGRTLAEMKKTIQAGIDASKRELDALTAKVVEAGLAFRPAGESDMLIVQGAAHMLQSGMERELESIQRIFDLLEQQETATRLLQEAAVGEGVQIFIGAENKVFQSNSLSMVISHYRDEKNEIIGATGVIGPTRLNYRQVIPMVDYTSQMIARLMSGAGKI